MNNNPFEPVTTDPAVDPPRTDGAADNFAANGDSDANKSVPDETTKASLSIDGISPSYGSEAAAPDDNPPISGPVSSAPVNISDNNTKTPGDILTDATAPEGFLNSMTTEDAKDNTTPVPGELPAPVAPVETKPEKPVKHVTISLLTIIFFVLTLAGAGGTVYFYLQNSKNANELGDAKAKIQELEDKLSTSSTTEGATAGQYDGLNDKIEDLSGKNEESTKTIEEYKKKNEEQAKQITELTAQNADLQKKAADVQSMKTNIDTTKSILDGICANNAGFCQQ